MTVYVDDGVEIWNYDPEWRAVGFVSSLELTVNHVLGQFQLINAEGLDVPHSACASLKLDELMIFELAVGS